MEYPKGFSSFGRNVGIKDQGLDFAVVFSETPCLAAGVFTRNNFPGAPVVVGREHLQNKKLQALVINSKNSNVATGERGVQDSRMICQAVADSLGIDPRLVLPSSTGVIGVPLPMDKILPACLSAKQHLVPGNLDQVAEAIMTTDTRKKISIRKIQHNQQSGIFFGFAKGAGMIEPNMATMLAYVLCDFLPESEDLQVMLRRVVNQTFNCMTIDSDTSTSDTVVVMASGATGTLPNDLFEENLHAICLDLTKQIARDGEGATKLIELQIKNASSEDQAQKIGKSILNSPLVKTALYGGDPNWGRFIMAIGKVFEYPVPFESLELLVGGISVKGASPETKTQMQNYLKSNEEIHLQVLLNQGSINKTFWSCDLTEGYIRENAYYTT